MVDNELRAEAVYQQLEDIEATVFYEKQLTSSDVSASGRVVIPKVRSHAHVVWSDEVYHPICRAWTWWIIASPHLQWLLYTTPALAVD
jgi:hypothetical protein